jgi:3-hydroxybutyryl-CoA dehydrogenase
MQMIVLTNDVLKEELLSDASSLHGTIIWVENIRQVNEYRDADVFIDLLFETGHITILQSLLPKTIVINSVDRTLAEVNSSFVRINAWPGFLKSSIIEASSMNEDNKQIAEKVFALFGKKLEWLPDQTGFVTPRVISMVINEAFIALKEGVSTKDEIDIAMKLGTNYPYGPFEWAEIIGMHRIDSLLKRLEKK